ncbi:hypothetical protein VKI21_10815 [Cyanobacterium aponinum UTEX 3222]|uniref:hypothetical protein n=1 Tax=Cyanobacterium aponinum TaxID=379064 RepID=UPI002B4BA801|nr:hypothetical protein [Cyanobacterium aponinum]WRL39130.1 hypothetical protein VKI22_03260 [Cyanobacterium aponinum UTEX 3221]WRL40563.1 hypothetical protein VKI21_10815 [Cyanobacterium aponinum UTEX 3222]
MSEQQKQEYLRIVHLLGGLRALINENQILEIIPCLSKKDNCIGKFDQDLINVLYLLKLKPIGIDYFTNIDHIKGYYPPEWRLASHYDYLIMSNLTVSIDMAWSHISSNRTLKDTKLRDLSNRITFFIRSCKYRLREISEAYMNELLILVKQQQTEERLFSSINTLRTIYAINAFLSDACMLRDRLAEFIAIYVYPDSSEKKISTFSSLRKYILKESLILNDSFANYLHKISAQEVEIGWLGEIGLYRDYLTHTGLLNNLQNSFFMRFDHKVLESNIKLPFLVFPLIDVEKIKHINSNIKTLDDMQQWRKQIDELNQKSKKDALEFCFNSLNNLLALASELIKKSLVKPEIIQLSADDIIGEIIIS